VATNLADAVPSDVPAGRASASSVPSGEMIRTIAGVVARVLRDVDRDRVARLRRLEPR
jgi:hypothetical protein